MTNLRPGDPVRVVRDVDHITHDIFGGLVCTLRKIEITSDSIGLAWAVVDVPGQPSWLPTNAAYLEFAIDCDHPGCLESVEVARDCYLSRRPTAPC